VALALNTHSDQRIKRDRKGHTMNAATSSLGPMANPSGPFPGAVASNAKPLWAAVGILGICVLAMGASLIHISKRPAEPVAAGSVPGVNALAMAVPNASEGASKGAMITETADGSPVPKTPATQQKSAQPATKNIAKQTTSKNAAVPTGASAKAPTAVAAPPQQVVAQATPQPAIAQAPPPVCANCGTVEAVTPVTRQGKGSGVGVVAGGVAGAVLGNQVGKGDGRTAATILGAVGGGWAGNAIEKNVKKTTVYAVSVRMEDGSTRNFEEATAPPVGAKVKVDGATLRSSDGAVYAPPAPEQRARATPQPQRDVYSNGG
jgi:outer membrane lipoprotein SlyB